MSHALLLPYVFNEPSLFEGLGCSQATGIGEAHDIPHRVMMSTELSYFQLKQLPHGLHDARGRMRDSRQCLRAIGVGDTLNVSRRVVDGHRTRRSLLSRIKAHFVGIEVVRNALRNVQQQHV